jgi:Domain of unknown function (DUF4402)
MKKIGTLALAITGLTFGSYAFAQSNSASTSANSTARVVTPISIAKTADMNFGDVVAGGSAGTVVLTTGGVRSATGGATLGNAGATAAAAFNVTGQGSATYSITLPVSTTVTSGGNTMTVDTFASNPAGTGTLSGGGSQALAVGATLNLAASQTSGTYTGTFNLSVTYN